MAGLITGIAGAVISAGTTAASFIQAGQQKRKQQDFEADAARALAEARKKLQVNYAEAMSVNKEPYNQERLAMLSAGAQLAQAAAESRRGVGAAAGQILASQQGVQQDISNRQGIDMQNIQNAILEEESRLRDVNVGLDVQEIAGQQQAAADAKLAAQMATQQGIQGIANTAQSVLSNENIFGLYGGNKGSETPATPAATTSQILPTPNGMPIQNKPVGSMLNAPPQMLPTPNGMPIQNQSNIGSMLNVAPQDTVSTTPMVDTSKFTSPEQAAAFGYVWDDISGQYVSTAPKFMSAFDVYGTTPTYKNNPNTPEFSSINEAAARGYVWDEKSGTFIKKQSLFY